MNRASRSPQVDRLRDLATGAAARLGGVPAVRTLRAILATYDRAGGGLVAGGLAYAALVALLPGLLLVASVAGLVITDPDVRADLVTAIAGAVPPLEDLARTALDTAAGGAFSGSVIALAGLAFGASRFYASLDQAFARIFHNAPERNLVVRWARSLVATVLVVLLPVTALVGGTVLSGFLQAPLARDGLGAGWGGLAIVGSPLLTIVIFIVGSALVFRLVPARHIPVRALLPPAILTGLAVGLFTQLFAVLAPLLLRIVTFYGAFVAVFGLLAWLSISLNVLLLGAAWTRVRMLGLFDGSGDDED